MRTAAAGLWYRSGDVKWCPSRRITMVYESVIDAIGNTPIVRLNKVAAGTKANVFAKLEFTNPGGSVKDRIGWYLIEDAEQRGTLKPGGTIIEGTSGNTGVGLAIAAAIKGYQCMFILPDKMSQEKIKHLRAFGARVIVPPDGGRAGRSAQLLLGVAAHGRGDAQFPAHRPVQQPRQPSVPL